MSRNDDPERVEMEARLLQMQAEFDAIAIGFADAGVMPQEILVALLASAQGLIQELIQELPSPQR